MGKRRRDETLIGVGKEAYPLQPHETENVWARQAWRHWSVLPIPTHTMETMPLCAELGMYTRAGRLAALSGAVLCG